MRNMGMEWQIIDTPIQLQEVSSIATPYANKLKLYAKDNGSGVSTLAYKNDAGTEMLLPTTGSFITGSGDGVAGRVAFFNGTSALGHEAELFYDTANNRLGIGATTPSQALDVVGQIRNIIASGTVNVSAQATASLSVGDPVRMIGGGFEGTNTHAADVRTTKRSAGNAATVEMFMYNGSAFAERFRFSYDHRISFGAWAPDNALDIRGGAAADSTISLREASADTAVGALLFYKSRGTTGSEAATASGDTIGAISFGGFTNALKANAVRIDAVTGSLWSATNAEAYLTFQTTPSGSLTRAERFRIGSAGQLGIGGATYGSSGDIFSSGGAAAAPTWVTRAALNAALDHGTLAGLTDDDHTGYARLGGRSTGQILYGDTASSGELTIASTSHGTKGNINIGQLGALYNEAANTWWMNGVVYGTGTSGSNLTLGSTSNATKGKIIFGSASVYDEVNDRFGIGQTAPAVKLDVGVPSAAGLAGIQGTIYDDVSGTTTGMSINARKTRGSSPTTHSALLSGDAIGNYTFQGSGGTTYATSASIRPVAAENFSETARGADIQFRNVLVTTTTLATAWTISATAGELIMGRAGAFIDLSAGTGKVLKVPTDNTDPTGGGVIGRIPIHDAAGNLRYIPYY